MPNDAKLGLIVGVGVVIAVAAVFFRKEAGVAAPLADTPAAAAVTGLKPVTAGAVAPSGSPVKAKPTAQAKGKGRQANPAVRRHTVKEGETLVSLAEFYYGDGEKSAAILEANQEVLKTPDELTPGMDLVIP